MKTQTIERVGAASLRRRVVVIVGPLLCALGCSFSPGAASTGVGTTTGSTGGTGGSAAPPGLTALTISPPTASLTISGGENYLSSLGQNIPAYRQFNGGAAMSITLYKALHLISRYDARHQEIEIAGYRRSSYRAVIGLAFSPGAVPLAIW